MKENVFNKEAFIEDVKENVKNLYRKTLDEASQQEIFQAVSYTVKDVIIDDWLANRKRLTNRIQRWFTTCPWSF